MNYEVGLVTEGSVVEIAKFGAFIKLMGGKTGLVHISEISDKFVQEVSDYVTIGARVIVKIISIDDKNRLQLSMKAVKPEELEKFQQEHQVREQEEEPPQREQEPPKSFASAPPPPRPRQDKQPDTFEKKLKSFMRQSEDRLVDVKRNIESKRGSRKRKK